MQATMEALALGVGASLCALIGILQWRADRAETQGTYSLLWICGFICMSGAFVTYAALLGGAAPGSNIVHAGSALLWSSTLPGPLLVTRIISRQVDVSRCANTLRAIALAASVGLTGLYLQGTFAPTAALDLDAYSVIAFYVAAAMAFIVTLTSFITRPSVPTNNRASLLVRLGVALAGAQVLATMTSIHGAGYVPDSLRSLASLISAYWPLPWAVLAAVHIARTHFADALLKHTLNLLVTVIPSAALTSTVLRVQPGLQLLLATIAIAALWLTAPLVYRCIARFVDTAVLRRPNYEELASRFAARVDELADESEVMTAVTDLLQSALRTPVVTAHDAPADTPDALSRINVRAPQGRSYTLSVTRSSQARHWMQEEQRFLQSIAVEAERRLATLHAERERLELRMREERLQRLLSESELKALRAQVDPHFLFNTLNAIADLIVRQPQQAEAMTERLAECFRYALTRHTRDLSTLDEELEFVRQYLGIEQVRFGERLQVDLNKCEATGRELVPSLILQPLVENAVRHGLAPLPEGGRVSVTATREGEFLRLEVTDTGIGLQSQRSKGTGIGLQNVRDRLHTLYRQTARMSIAAGAAGRGTCITLLVPAHES